MLFCRSTMSLQLERNAILLLTGIVLSAPRYVNYTFDSCFIVWILILTSVKTHTEWFHIVRNTYATSDRWWNGREEFACKIYVW